MPKPSHRRHDTQKIWSRIASRLDGNDMVDYCDFGPKTRRGMAKQLKMDGPRCFKLIQRGRAWEIRDWHKTGFYVHTLGVPHIEDAGNVRGWWLPPERQDDQGG